MAFSFDSIREAVLRQQRQLVDHQRQSELLHQQSADILKALDLYAQAGQVLANPSVPSVPPPVGQPLAIVPPPLVQAIPIIHNEAPPANQAAAQPVDPPTVSLLRQDPDALTPRQHVRPVDYDDEWVDPVNEEEPGRWEFSKTVGYQVLIGHDPSIITVDDEGRRIFRFASSSELGVRAREIGELQLRCGQAYDKNGLRVLPIKTEGARSAASRSFKFCRDARVYLYMTIEHGLSEVSGVRPIPSDWFELAGRFMLTANRCFLCLGCRKVMSDGNVWTALRHLGGGVHAFQSAQSLVRGHYFPFDQLLQAVTDRSIERVSDLEWSANFQWLRDEILAARKLPAWQNEDPFVDSPYNY